MKRIFLSIIISGLLFTGTSAQENSDSQSDSNKKPVRLLLRIVPTAIQSGNILDFKKTLTPEPDRLDASYIGAGLDVYFLNNLGITAGWDFLGTFNANKSGYSSLKIADISKIFAGLAFKIKLFGSAADSYTDNELDLKISGGANYNFFSLTDKYKSLFSGISFYANPATGFGFFAGGGLEALIGTTILGIGVYYNSSNYKFPSATSGHAMATIEVPIYIGFAF